MRFHVPQMTCGHCVRTLRHAVETAFPQSTVDVDLTRREVEVSDAAPDRLAEVIRAVGYEPLATGS